MRSKLQAAWVAALLLVAPAARAGAPTFVETFDGGSNTGGWTYGGPGSIPPNGGNPGAYLNSGTLDTFAPQLRTSLVGTVFTGNYRTKGVTELGVDLIQLSNTTTGGRPCTLMLFHNNNTPGNPNDDTAAYFLGPNIPAQGQGWKSYDFVVPSQDTTLPAGWQLLNMGNIDDPPLHTWDQVIQHVDKVQYFYGDPTFVFIFQLWVVGADNLRITEMVCESAAGAVPDGAAVPGTMLTVQKAPLGNIRLRWDDSCNLCDSDYAVYEGQIGDWYSHVVKHCTTGGLLIKNVTPAPGDTYYLVAPHNGKSEGSYGQDSGGNEIPAAPAPCLPQEAAACR